nr:MAG TPA: hypothetical protein [Caudoviricetes sp.]
MRRKAGDPTLGLLQAFISGIYDNIPNARPVCDSGNGLIKSLFHGVLLSAGK